MSSPTTKFCLRQAPAISCFDVRRRRERSVPYCLASDNGGSETRGYFTRRAEVRTTHTEYDVLKHIDDALAAINVHLAVLLPPFHA